MQQFKLNKGSFVFCLLLLLKFSNSKAQEVINNVSLEKVSSTSYKVRYKLNKVNDYELNGVTLKIYRRRAGQVQEVFSQAITPSAGVQANQTYSYNWKTAAGVVKDADELQARILVSYNKPAPVVKTPEPIKTNLPPKANAGADIDLQLPVRNFVTLDGMRSYDEDGRIVSVKWRQISGPGLLSLSSQESYKSQVAGDFFAGMYVFELTVQDDAGATATDRVNITVKAAPVVPPVTQPTVAAPKKQDSIVKRAVASKPVMPKLKGGPNNALLDILLPGVGHYFVSGDHYGNDRKPTGFLITALYGGAIGGAVYYKLRSNSEYNKYIELSQYREYQRDANGSVIGIRGANQAQATQYLSDSKNSQNNFLILCGVSAGIMVADVAYTFIKGSKNKKNWETDAGVHIKPFISSDGSNFVAGVSVKF